MRGKIPEIVQRKIETELKVDANGKPIGRKKSKITNDIVGTNQEYRSTYMEAYDHLEALMSLQEMRLYFYLVKRFIPDVPFTLSKRDRIAIGRTIQFTERTILDTVPLLIARGFLYLDADGRHAINPRYTHKGSRRERKDQLQKIMENKLEKNPPQKTEELFAAR